MEEEEQLQKAINVDQLNKIKEDSSKAKHELYKAEGDYEKMLQLKTEADNDMKKIY